MAEIEAQEDRKAFKEALAVFLGQAGLHLMLDGGTLIVAHTRREEDMIGKTDSETQRFVLNGDGRDWAAD